MTYIIAKKPGIVTFQVTILFGLSFMRFLSAIFSWLFDWNFAHVFFKPFWIGIIDFGVRTSNFRAFVLLYRYILICEMETHSEGPQ